MKWQILPALAAAFILVRIRGKNDKKYIHILTVIFYVLSFLGIYYFARKATIFLYGNFSFGRNQFIWMCLLAASVFYFPCFEKTGDLRILFRECLEIGFHLFVFAFVSLFGFCTQLTKGGARRCWQVC